MVELRDWVRVRDSGRADGCYGVRQADEEGEGWEEEEEEAEG